MRRRQRRIRRWLALGAAVAALSFASSASAMVVADNGGGNTVQRQTAAAITESSTGFNWSDAAIGAGIALSAAFAGAGILRITGGRRRLAGLLH